MSSSNTASRSSVEEDSQSLLYNENIAEEAAINAETSVLVAQPEPDSPSVPHEVQINANNVKESAVEKTHAHGSDQAEETVLHISGWQWSWWRLILYILAALCSGGILLLFSFWYPKIYTYGTKRRVKLSDATHVLLKGIDKTWEEVTVSSVLSTFKFSDDKTVFANFAKYVDRNGTIRLFDYRNLRFVYDNDLNTFVKPEFRVSQVPYNDIHKDMSQGIQDAEFIKFSKILFGDNTIVIPIPSILNMLLNEMLHPFYIFQCFSVAVWWAEGYIYYPIAIVFISTTSITTTIYYTRKNLFNLRDMAKSECQVNISRFGNTKQLWSAELIPGDVVELENDISLPCDFLLLSGEAVMNESMLTGESNPVLKQNIPHSNDTFIPQLHKKHTLFCGTKVMQLKCKSGGQKVVGLVIRTGFGTTKGNLFNSILFPKPIKFKVYRDSLVFVALMAAIAIAAFIWSSVNLVADGYDAAEVVLSSLDLITIAIPPALPLVLTIGVGFAINRLRQAEVFCTSPQRVNYCGKINLMCFDKTGTLTEDDLSVLGVQPATSHGFSELASNVPSVDPGFLDVLVSTHSVSKINGVYLGHPVDVRMFESTKWSMEDTPAEVDTSKTSQPVLATYINPTNEDKIEVLRRFEFEPALQRMSVVIRKKDKVILCTKGSPEVIRTLCTPDCIPADFEAALRNYAQKGLYVLGCAYREISEDELNGKHIESLKRDTLETTLHFGGLLLFENKLKPETPAVIEELHGAEIKILMITGDNVHTAIAVARNCDLIDAARPVYIGDATHDTFTLTSVDNPSDHQSLDELLHFVSQNATPKKNMFGAVAKANQLSYEIALTGKAIKYIVEHNHHQIFLFSRIFARTSPDQKQLLCEYLMDMGFFVGMCGDGTNDCGALKAAHAGLALSDAEASVVAPFTSKKKSISDVIIMIKEGRCALQTSFVAFKYMIAYPVLQLLSAVRLYQISSVLGDFQYLFDDIIIVLPLAMLMCYTEAWPTLGKRAPASSLFTPRILLSIVFELTLHVGMMIAVNIYAERQSWFIPIEDLVTGGADALEDQVKCMENFVTFTFTNFCYVSTALSLSSAKPFRKWFFSNWWFTAYLIIAWLLCSLILLIPPGISILELQHHGIPESFKFMMWLLAWLTMLFAWAVDCMVIEGPIGQAVEKWLTGGKMDSKDFEMEMFTDISKKKSDSM